MSEIRRTELVVAVVEFTYEIEVPVNQDAYPGCTTALEAAQYDVKQFEEGESDFDLLFEGADVEIIEVKLP